MATQRVAFEITTDESGAVQGMRRIGEEADKLGARGGRAFQLITKQQKEAREATQLLSRSLGVEVPAGLEKILAKTPHVSGALAGLFRLGVVTAFAAALVGVVNNFDEIQVAIKKAGFQLALFGDKVRALFTGRESAVAGGVRVEFEQKFIHPILDQIRGVQEATDLALKQGVAAIQEQRRQALAAADRLAEDQKRRASDEAGGYDTEKYRNAAALIDSSVAQLRVQIEANADKEILKLRLQMLDRIRAAEAETFNIGLKGSAQIMAQLSQQIDALKVERSRGAIDDSTFRKLRTQAEQQATEKISELVKNAQLEEQQLRNQTAELAVSGEARILAAAENRISEERRLFQENFSWLGEHDAARVEAERALQAKIIEIDRQAAIELKRMREQFAQETAQIDAEAATLMLPPWFRANQQILDDFERQMAELRRLKNEGAIDDEEFASRRVAMEHLKNAKILDENRRMVEQLADDYESAYEDIFGGRIADRILKNAKRFAFLLLAQLTLGGRNGQQQGGGLLGTLGGILGGLIFGPRSAAGQAAGGGIPGANSFLPGGTAFYGGSGGVQVGGAAAGGGGGVNIPDLEGASGGGGSSRTGALGGLLGSGRGGLVAGLGIAGAGLVGSKFGGTLGALGATAGALGIINILKLSKATGLSIGALQTTMGGLLYGGTAGGLIGFGVGAKYGKTAGAISGGATGALVGLITGGPIGALLGGIVGLFSGLFGGLFGGSKRKKQANQFVDQQLLPQLKQIQDQYENFQMDYGSAIANLDALAKQSDDTLRQLRGEGKSVLRNRALPEIDRVRKLIQGDEATRLIRAAREYAPPQYHDGGTVRRRGLRSNEQLAVLEEGEEVIKKGPAAKNRGLLKAINSGDAVGGGGGDIYVQLSPQRLDRHWLMNGGAEEIAAAIRAAQMEGRI